MVVGTVEGDNLDYRDRGTEPTYSEESAEVLGEFLTQYDEELSPDDLEGQGPEELTDQVKEKLTDAYEDAKTSSLSASLGWTTAAIMSYGAYDTMAAQGDEIGMAGAAAAGLINFTLAGWNYFHYREASQSKPDK